MSYYGVFHGDRRESSKLKTAFEENPSARTGFLFQPRHHTVTPTPCAST
jgi:hypothetical protein